MPRFAKRYTDAQVAALTDYAIRRGVPARRAIEEAQSGRLFPTSAGTPGERFAMPLKTAQDYINKERRRRALARLPNVAQLPLRDGVGTLSARLLAIADKKVRALEREGARAPAAEAIQVARLLGEIAKLEPGRGTSTPTGGRGTAAAPRGGTEAPRGFLDGLADEDRSDAPGEQTTQPPTQRDGDTTVESGSDPAPNQPSTANAPINNGVRVPTDAAASGVGEVAAPAAVTTSTSLAARLYSDR